MKSKYLSALLCPYNSLKWCCSKEESPATTSTSTSRPSTLQISRSRAAMLDSLSDLPESETSRELSFSFLLNNGSTDNNSNIDDGVVKEELPTTTASVTVNSVTMKEKKMRSRRVASNSSNDSMFSYLCGPISFTRSQSTRQARYENRKANGVSVTQILACSSGRRKVHQC